MIGVGIVGLGVMGGTHLDVFSKRRDARVVAVADRDQGRRTGQVTVQGNIDGQSQSGFDFSSVRQYADALDLIHDPNVDLVDICLPTPFHLSVAKLALQAGKHVLVEKPLARTTAEADELARLAASATGLSFCAMCMRFWPGWDWLKEAVDRKTYGKVLSATFRRVAQFPGGPFYSNGEACGGAILDLHIHDSDFINFLFGLPTAVTSRGYSRESGACDHVVTHYHYEQIPLVVAEGGWSMAPGFG
ncbi:MAG TPA: Gfo/Idh/MocA family oxidoreductase, partial [Planctomicrobium sp.]|nr:Gfo/Idh/MocA family oxidoreductase [Planctomicrobium sp.]